MIILIEPDKNIRKRLSDLLSRERLIGVDSIQQGLQMIYKFRDDLDLIITNIAMLSQILDKQIILKVCEKLLITEPPIFAFYTKENENLRKAFIKTYKDYSVIEYNEKDIQFPIKYLDLIKELCPRLITDVEKAKENWMKAKQPDQLIDPRKWLEEEGFMEILPMSAEKTTEKETDEIISSIEAMLEEKKVEETQVMEQEEDYKSLYFELKKKYDDLLKNIQTFMDAVRHTDK